MAEFNTTKPGVYFDMSFADYLADPSLSASGIKDILVAPETYYERSSMNPVRTPKDTEALAYGSATHTRSLEGRAVFDEEYAIIPDPADYPDAIVGGKALKEACDELNLVKSGTVLELADRIAEAAPDAQIWLHIMRDFEDENTGKTFLKKDWADKIERRAQLLESIPEVAKAITGGFAEVSIFWIDKATGVPLKARVDYLKTKAQIDLKSFTNQNGKPVDTALAHAVANYRYYVQVAVHSEAVTQAKMLMRGGKFKATNPPSKEWIKAFTEAPIHVFVFLFLEKAAVPCIRLKEFPRLESPRSRTPTLAWDAGQGCFRRGVQIWGDFMNRFGPDKPWIDVPPMDRFHDEDFPMYMLED
ncbi:MAG: PD-(D/E)XK nuclease-like domain-containing protein [Magnetovibrio sp.]|nr:PD-(D/E)XK nuclease-like domain-containing protein [Magnetovibrio sp.]